MKLRIKILFQLILGIGSIFSSFTSLGCNYTRPAEKASPTFAFTRLLTGQMGMHYKIAGLILDGAISLAPTTIHGMMRVVLALAAADKAADTAEKLKEAEDEIARKEREAILAARYIVDVLEKEGIDLEDSDRIFEYLQTAPSEVQAAFQIINEYKNRTDNAN